jgi:hypothetical protein
VTARKIPAGEVQLRWRACGLDLATPGRIVVMRDVSALGASLAQLGICAMYGMSADGLIDVAFAPTALQASAPQASPRLRSMAALAGVDPATLIDWHLAASGLPLALGTPGQGQEP